MRIRGLQPILGNAKTIVNVDAILVWPGPDSNAHWKTWVDALAPVQTIIIHVKGVPVATVDLVMALVKFGSPHPLPSLCTNFVRRTLPSALCGLDAKPVAVSVSGVSLLPLPTILCLQGEIPLGA